jgi:hypothetical protein
MKHDAKILEQLVAMELHNLAGTTPGGTGLDGGDGAGNALGINDGDLKNIGGPRAFALAWEFAIESVARSLNFPAGDGSELREIVANMRDRFYSDLQAETEDRELESRNRQRKTPTAATK